MLQQQSANIPLQYKHVRKQVSCMMQDAQAILQEVHIGLTQLDEGNMGVYSSKEAVTSR